MIPEDIAMFSHHGSPPRADPSVGSTTIEEDKDEELPIADLWSKYQTEQTIQSYDDYFEEMQNLMEQGESLFTCPILPTHDELGIETDEGDVYDTIGDDNMGIEIPGKQFYYYTFFWAGNNHYNRIGCRGDCEVNIKADEGNRGSFKFINISMDINGSESNNLCHN